MKKENIFPLAIGTFGLGASRSEAWSDNNEELIIDEKEMESVIYSYNKGQNYLDCSYIYAGTNVKKGGDDTLFCLCDGVVKYEHLGKDRTKVSVYPVA